MTRAAIVAALCAAWLLWSEARVRRWVPGLGPPTDQSVLRIQAAEALASRGRDGIPELVAAVSSPDAKVRRTALYGLARLGPTAGDQLETVRALLADKDPNVRSGAVRAFWQISANPEVAGPVIAPFLADPDDDVREVAGQALESMRAPPLGPVIRVIETERGAARLRAMLVLRKTRWDESRVLEIFRRLAADDDEACRDNALMALLEWNGADISHIREALHRGFTGTPASWYDPAPNSVDAALGAVVRLGPQASELAPDLVRLLEQASTLEYPIPTMAERPDQGKPRLFQLGTQPAAVLKALGSMKQGARSAVPALLQLVNQVHDSCRISFARTLFDIGAEPNEVVPILLPILRDAPRLDAWEAGRVLVEASPEEARRQVALAIPKLKDGDNAVNKDALFVIYGLAPEASEAVPGLRPLVKNPDAQVSAVAVEILGEIGPESAPALPELLESLRNGPADFGRLRLIRSIARIGPAAKDAVSMLVEIVNQANADRRADRQNGFRTELLAAALAALGRLGPASPDVIKLLRSRLDDPADDVRAAALESLALAGDSEVVLGDLVRLLADPSGTVRAKAALEISRLRTDRQEAVTPLIETLGDESPYVRTAAAIALGKIGPSAKRSLPVLRALLTRSENLDPNSKYSPPRPISMPPPELTQLSVEQTAREAISAIDRD